MAFVLVLSLSRQIFLRFYLNQRMDNFLRGHVAAFSAFAGVPRVVLYDNLRSAVLERRGDAIRFHPTLLELSARYRFEPRPVAPARGNEKGRVERLAQAVPASGELLRQAGERGTPLARATSELVELLDAYGASALEQAVAEALAHAVPHPNAVRQVLERRREQPAQPPPLTLTLPDNDKARHIVVRPASLAPYDQLYSPPTEPLDDYTD